jgi:hypothetical protein
MNTRTSRCAAVLVAFVAVASPSQTFAEDGVELFEPDVKHLKLIPEVVELLQKARKAAREGDKVGALEYYERAYQDDPCPASAAELGIFELAVGEYVDAAKHITSNGEDAQVDIDGKIRVMRGFSWIGHVEPGKPKSTLKQDKQGPESVGVEIKAGEDTDLSVGTHREGDEGDSHAKRPGLLYRPSNRPMWRPLPQIPERPEWAKTLLYTSSAALGVSLAVGIVGFIVERQAVDDVTVKHAGIGMEVGGAIGLGFSLTGLLIALGSTPTTVQNIYTQGSTPKPSATLVVTPQIGPRMVGLGVQGTF